MTSTTTAEAAGPQDTARMFDTVGTRAAYLGDVSGEVGGEMGGEVGGEEDGEMLAGADDPILGKCIVLDFADNLLYTFMCLAETGVGPLGGVGMGAEAAIGRDSTDRLDKVLMIGVGGFEGDDDGIEEETSSIACCVGIF